MLQIELKLHYIGQNKSPSNEGLLSFELRTFDKYRYKDFNDMIFL